MQRKPKVLFLSTGDSTRGVMAEGFLRALAGEHFQTVSTGIQPEDVHPVAIDVMAEVGIDISGQKPRTVAESLRDQFGYVVIVYDPSKERSPIFPFAPHLLRWNICDPAAEEGSHTEKKEAFRRVRNEIRGRIENFLTETMPASQQPAAMAA